MDNIHANISNASSEEDSVDPEEMNGWIPALAATTALFGISTVVLAVALVCVLCRHSRRKGRSCSEKEIKGSTYWIGQEPTLDENINDAATPNVWYPPDSSETFDAEGDQKEGCGDGQRGKMATSVSLVRVNPRSLAQVGPNSVAQAGLKASLHRKVQPKRVAPPPPRSKKGKSRRAKHMSKDNDYAWPENARDYQNVQQFLGTGAPQPKKRNPYKEIDVEAMDAPSNYAHLFSKPP